MGRKPSKEIQVIRDTLRAMVGDGFRQPGQRFVSGRYVSFRFGISYQTAHLLLKELEHDGFLNRRIGSGTFISGQKVRYRRARIVFAKRAGREGSFGDFLLRQLVTSLEQQRIEFIVTLQDIGDRDIGELDFPVIWERPELVHSLAKQQRRCLVLHDLPPPGIASLFVDSVSVDNFSGGMTAGQILARLSPKRPVIVAGPLTDVRSALRTKGFLHIFPKARVIELESWFVESAQDKILPQLRSWSIDGLFCCSDRLAQATIISYAHSQRPTPPLISFDNTPLAEKLRISAIGIPWERLCKEATAIVKLRLAGHEEAASCHILPPQPVLRILKKQIFEYPEELKR
ncbi:MAG: substrate-binding domain-containing protein [Verrucomicrobia bacterium]|nr:substrate-binding domain-containing protein [Verrucomicrobiota bacterium]